MPELPEALRLFEALKARGVMLACAESCTGGLLCDSIISIPGSSSILDRGWITYSNQSKTELLGVSDALLNTQGAVSSAVAAAMAQGALKGGPAQLALAVTGIAGPNGGSAQKPVGLVYIAAALRTGVSDVEEHRFSGSRADIRAQSVRAALLLGLSILQR